MEIKYNYKDNLLTFNIIEKEINGIVTENYKEIITILNDNIKERLSIVKEEETSTIYQQTIYALLLYKILNSNIIVKNIDKKIKESLRIVGLKESLLLRNYYTLSTSEKKLISLAIGLLTNPNILILIEPFKGLDNKNEKKLVMLLNKIKDNYNKTIIIISNNTNIIYKYTKYTIIYKNKKVLIEDNTEDLFTKISYLKRNRIDIPEIVEFINLAKEKNKLIEYHKDIRDIIKDIYRHV